MDWLCVKGENCEAVSHYQSPFRVSQTLETESQSVCFFS